MCGERCNQICSMIHYEIMKMIMLPVISLMQHSIVQQRKGMSRMRHTNVKIITVTAALSAALLGMTGCSGLKQEPLPEVKLSIWWGDESDRELIGNILEEFKAEYAEEAHFDITVSKEDVQNSKGTVLSNPSNAADIYMFADDQFEALRQAGALLEITENTDQVINANGGVDNGACRSAMHDGKLYAYPLTAGNGYFLYYNSAYFEEEDLKSLDRILEIAAENGKKMTMDYSSGWYIYSFFKGAGLELGLNPDGISNYCNWNATDTPYKGVDVAESMLRIAMHEGFLSCDDAGFLYGVENGTIIAGINGAWNVETVKKAWGENFAAAKLPCYMLAGDSVQMCSFSGYKLLGINPNSENSYWAMKLAERLSDEEAQTKRFELVGECPSNIKAASSALVQTSPAIAALAEQSEYAYAQRIADSYWHPTYIFGITIAGGNSDDQDLQTLLDNMTMEITGTAE